MFLSIYVLRINVLDMRNTLHEIYLCAHTSFNVTLTLSFYLGEFINIGLLRDFNLGKILNITIGTLIQHFMSPQPFPFIQGN